MNCSFRERRKEEMAQAARLNLRMQKELKLLLTDPPPGASFPSLSDDSYASSLTSIDALLQGPEGTAYVNGVFKIKIQIPERYPFQPPVVTFTTPIYHPNIDNGGRICLDILNLPPKGMWQPSLNISTVLTSIGLLLSEPNPDDGLMHEASRDYKYNRQAFDQNARSMTEKYARAGETESARGSYGSGGSTENAKMEGAGASMSTTECRKQSLDTLGSCSNEGTNGKEIYNVSHDNSKNNTEFGPPLKEPSNDLLKCTGNLGKLQAMRTKLSLKVSVASLSRNYESEETTSLPNHCSLVQVNQEQSLHGVGTYQSKSANEKLHGLDATKPQEGLSCSISTNHHKTNAHKDAIARKGNCSISTKLKKIGSVGQNHLIEEKENLAPVQCLAYQSAASTNMSSTVSENGMYCNKSVNHGLHSKHLDLKKDIVPDQKQQKINQLCVRESSTDKLKQVGDIEGSHVAEAVIVLDSEESEDEIAAVRSKLSLAKRCLSRKRKSAFGS